MARIIAEAINDKVSLTVQEAKYIDLGWTGIAKSIMAGMAIIVHESEQDVQHTIKSIMADIMLTS